MKNSNRDNDQHWIKLKAEHREAQDESNKFIITEPLTPGVNPPPSNDISEAQQKAELRLQRAREELIKYEKLMNYEYSLPPEK